MCVCVCVCLASVYLCLFAGVCVCVCTRVEKDVCIYKKKVNWGKEVAQIVIPFEPLLCILHID